jgi:hypothetical protein
MKPNEGAADRIVRIVLAVALAALIVTNVVTGVSAIVVGILAAILAVTGIVSFCPLYAVFGLKTCPAKVAK